MNKDVIQSVNSIKSFRVGSGYESAIEDLVDFGDVIIAAVNKFECPISVDVCRNSVAGFTHQKPERKTKMGTAHTPMVLSVSSDFGHVLILSPWIEKFTETELAGSALIITALHNHKNRLIEIAMHKYRYQEIPRIVLKVLGVILPSYTKLRKFVIRDCSIDKYTIPELTNILSVTKITEVCLDLSSLPEGNYDVLLQQATSLQNLSLKRCNINDDVCQRIASNLQYSKPAESVLLILNLTSNDITDVGAKYIAKAIRSNRHLRYLNLSDNRITDEGAKHILNALKEFPLSPDEIMNKRRHYMKYLQKYFQMFNRCLLDFENNSNEASKKSSTRKTSSIMSANSLKRKVNESKKTINESLANTKAEMMAKELLGPFNHPFYNTQVVIKDGGDGKGTTHSKGNMVLSCLNLAYNNLMLPSVRKFLEVLEYQKIHRSDNLSGLMKVVIDGNNLPENCTELDSINDILKLTSRNFNRSKYVSGVAVNKETSKKEFHTK